ncbi:MAG TPA: ACT domain-containing protein [Acidobacteriota bacterium]|nr:ACT domain-containing protein [Acidobacteriota bacterium]
MPTLSTDIKKLLTQTSLVVFPEDYVAVYLPTGIKSIPGEWFRPDTTRFAAVIQEPALITMIVPRGKWLRMKNMFEKYDVSGPLKAITFDVRLSMVAGKFRIAIASALAEANINSIPISSFKRYHVIVPKADLPRTVRVLRNLISCGKKKRTARSKK